MGRRIDVFADLRRPIVSTMGLGCQASRLDSVVLRGKRGRIPLYRKACGGAWSAGSTTATPRPGLGRPPMTRNSTSA